MASITIVTEAGEESYPLGASAVVLGRGLESDVRLKDIKASRRHCQIVKTPQGFQIVDLSSGNGTYVNGVQIRQQVLAAGDKIQIGSTTITFTEGAPAAKPAPRPAAAPAPAPSPVAATARVAAAASTGRNAAVKAEPAPASAAPALAPSTGKLIAAKPAPPPAPRASTQVAAKTGGASSRKLGMGRATGSIRPAPRPREELPKKKAGAGKILLVAVGAVFLGVVGFILLGRSGEGGDRLQDQIKKLEDEAVAARRAGRFDEAKAKYLSMTSKIEGNEKFKKKNVEAKKAIEDLEALATADKRFAAFKARAEKPKEGEAAELFREGKELYQECSGDAFPWLKELKGINDRLEKAADSAGGAKRLDFQAVRTEINDRCKLGSSAPEYAQAIGEWQVFAGEKKVSEEARQKAQAEIRGLNDKARQEAERLKGRAETMAKENKKAEAIEEIKSHRPRFKDTAAAEDLEAIIRELEK